MILLQIINTGQIINHVVWAPLNVESQKELKDLSDSHIDEIIQNSVGDVCWDNVKTDIYFSSLI